MSGSAVVVAIAAALCRLIAHSSRVRSRRCWLPFNVYMYVGTCCSGFRGKLLFLPVGQRLYTFPLRQSRGHCFIYTHCCSLSLRKIDRSGRAAGGCCERYACVGAGCCSRCAGSVNTMRTADGLLRRLGRAYLTSAELQDGPRRAHAWAALTLYLRAKRATPHSAARIYGYTRYRRKDRRSGWV